MNKIVRDHYPVSSLPEDLREGLDPNNSVRIVIEETTPPAQTQLLRELLDRARRSPPIGDDPVARIRELRDEWDD
jgi:hypothetical protein